MFPSLEQVWTLPRHSQLISINQIPHKRVLQRKRGTKTDIVVVVVVVVAVSRAAILRVIIPSAATFSMPVPY
jgi:hypothetical protein